MEKELFSLLRLGLGLSTVEYENLSGFIILTALKWTHIIDLARKHGVLGIVVDGIEQLERSEAKGYGLLKGLPVNLKMEVIGEVLQIEQRNRQQIALMNELAEKWRLNGCRVMVMKGQANGTFYPKSEHRSPGDIDCYLFENYASGNDLARTIGANVDESWYKHSVISYKGETFENHQYFVHTRDGKRGKRLEKELEEALLVQDSRFTAQGCVLFPPVQWNAMFLTYHACAHFVSEGLRLKQILDWAMFLNKHQDEVDWEAFCGFCERNHLRRFAEATTAIAVKNLNVNLNDNKMSVTESPYAERVLRNALYEDDYVFSSGESGWKNRLHIVRNLFRYRWKYEEIYEENIFRQLYFYATGLLFKTE